MGATTSSSVSLSWTASTDNVAVTAYQVFRNGAIVGTTSSSPFTDTGLTAATAHTYTVRARDAAGNVSAASAAVTATTQPGGGGKLGRLHSHLPHHQPLEGRLPGGGHGDQHRHRHDQNVDRRRSRWPRAAASATSGTAC